MTRAIVLMVLAVVAAVVVATTPAVVGIAVSAIAVLLGGWFAQRAAATPANRGAPRSPAAAPPDVPSAPTSTWIDAMPCGVLLLDDQLLVVDLNEAAASLCGRPRAGIVGLSLIRAIRDHNVVQIAREGAGVPREVDVRDGNVVRVTATKLATPFERVRHVLALEDLTALRRAQRARSDLVANASHELRTPVTAALALAETLESGVPDEDRRHDFHTRLTTEIVRLSEIIGGLLTLSRLESQTEAFVTEPLLPRELLESAARRIEPLLTGDQSIAVIDESSSLVDGDRERVLEVLSNLLDNALRVSPPDGAVTLGAYEGEDEVRFEVRDQGPGILPGHRARVFERFYTGEESRTERRTSGLGLAIARHVVSRLGGRIWVADRTPGATLCFTLPLSDDPADTAESADERPSPANGMNEVDGVTGRDSRGEAR